MAKPTGSLNVIISEHKLEQIFRTDQYCIHDYLLGFSTCGHVAPTLCMENCYTWLVSGGKHKCTILKNFSIFSFKKKEKEEINMI